MIKVLFRKFQVKVTLILILAMLFIGGLSNFMIYRFSLQFQFNDLRNKLMICAQTAALMIDAQVIKQIPLNKEEGLHSERYIQTLGILKRVKNVNPMIKYVYIMGRTEKEGAWRFIVDADPVMVKERKHGSATAYPGDPYDASRFPEMMKAFDGPSADTKLEVDEWGVTLSAYAPVRDEAGSAVAMLGVDMAAEDVYAIRRKIHYRARFVLAVGLIVSLLLGAAVAGGVTRRVEKLVDGTERFAAGDLSYRVKINGNDEISELARSLNGMAKSLDESRKKLLSYFYDVAKSMVRIIEARDRYMKGHSERVAEYAVKIAGKMGFSKDKIELLEETALLHDIGKLGIEESILNKKEKLTEEEWEIIRQHPVIGEDMLRPITLTPELLTIVRGHHERYDGKGYPDRLTGENISVFTSILSVADAYSAMTTERPYKRAMNKEEAIKELKGCAGTQFNPKIVNIFLDVLKGL